MNLEICSIGLATAALRSSEFTYLISINIGVLHGAVASLGMGVTIVQLALGQSEHPSLATSHRL